MAKWRALHASITTDGKVNRMSEFAQLLYDRMMVKADDWGIITGDTFELKGETIPLSSRNFQELDDVIQEMVGQDLVWRYEPEGFGPLVQVKKFDDHQPRSVVAKRTAPKVPLHPDWKPMPWDKRSMTLLEVIGNSENCCPRVEENREEENREEENREDTTTTRKPTLSSIWIKKTGQLIQGIAAEKIDGFEDEYPRAWIVDAIDEACLSSKGPPTIKYLMAILVRWKREGKGSVPKREGKHGKHRRDSEPQLTPEQVAEYFPES